MKLFFQNTKKPRKKINCRPPVNPNDAMLNKTQITSHKNKYKTPLLSSLPFPTLTMLSKTTVRQDPIPKTHKTPCRYASTIKIRYNRIHKQNRQKHHPAQQVIKQKRDTWVSKEQPQETSYVPRR